MVCQPIWAEIDLQAIIHNLNQIRGAAENTSQIMAVVKADAYGHGAIPVAKACLQNNASWLGVARVSEAVHIRRTGISAPILILGYSPPDCASDIIQNKLSQTVYSLQAAQDFSQVAQRVGQKIKIHLKIDTGMGRLGILAGEQVGGSLQTALTEIEAIAKLPGLELEGIFTHFACADSKDKNSALAQLELFQDLIFSLNQKGIEFKLRHCANSAAIIDLPPSHFNLVRGGIMLYGLYPSEEVDKTRVALRPAMQLKARIAHIKKVPAGFKISYGETYVTKRPTLIATVPVGYADGYDRGLSSRASMLVHGQKVPVVGRVCMDQTMIDVGSVKNVCVGDEVVIFGRQGQVKFDADDIANLTSTINYEVVSTLMARVPRIYLP